jgi:hypothetical protein
MRLMFIYYAFAEQGSGLVLQAYTDAAREMGHEVCVFGRNKLNIPLNYTLDAESADAVIFLFEWTTQLQYEDQLDLLRLVSKVSRRRRVILDGDGNYNDPIHVEDDYNHRDDDSSRRWTEICDSLADKICQPTLHPLRPNVRPFLFYGYNPAWEVPFTSNGKPFDMLYIGHCKWRWRPMRRVLDTLEDERAALGRIGFVGHGWAKKPWWAATLHMEDTYYSEPGLLQKLAIEVLPPIAFAQVIDWMSKAVVNPVLLRPTFNRMRLVTPRMFETPAANTIPLFAFDPDHAREIYGNAALDLVLRQDGTQMLRDMVQHPDSYGHRLTQIRAHLADRHSHKVRLRQLLEIVES